MSKSENPISDIWEPEWGLQLCKICGTMTNHDDSGCLRCRSMGRMGVSANNIKPLDKLDMIIDQIWCAGYNKGTSKTDYKNTDNTEFIKDMKAEIFCYFDTQPKATENNFATVPSWGEHNLHQRIKKGESVDRQSDETRLAHELEDILQPIRYYADIVEIDEAEEKILAWHETEKQKAIELVDRFEVIDEAGRAYVKGSIYGSPVKVKLSFQDDNRTLKIFVEQRELNVNKEGRTNE